MTISVDISEINDRPLEFLLSEAHFHRSRDNLVFTGGAFVPGEVFGVGRTDTVITATPGTGNTGNGVITMAAPAFSADAMEGNYVLIALEPLTNAGTFEVTNPRGEIVGTANVGVAYTGEIKFTIADGSVDFLAGDRFIINVAPGTTKAIKLVSGKLPGGVCCYPYDASIADVRGVGITRDAEVKAPYLIWPVGITGAQQATAIIKLSDRGVIAR